MVSANDQLVGTYVGLNFEGSGVTVTEQTADIAKITISSGGGGGGVGYTGSKGDQGPPGQIGGNGADGYTGSKGDQGPAGTPGLIPYLDLAPDNPEFGQMYFDASEYKLKIYALQGWLTIGPTS
jgi:hypothetical protein